MSVNVSKFEVRVRIKSARPIRYHPWKDGEEYLKQLRMYHIDARTHRQAAEIARKKYGQVVSCREVDADRIKGNPGTLPLDNAKYVNISPYASAVAMDEMIWNKHKKRRKNLLKEKLKEY